eukprot:CAMPEP_0116835472 /NCGR_PEP_ID=MMETSP0418-20121206/7564_1 /TAXON_ID=1158023 /ORGANISM="Astrosyne radiata, Strain 13vi08-1A" /LENGTH=207 /DNA_ID=CAMNT_0004465143 /DNA_START=230 /DNA_END=853 /DNA_ORIENTATION=+
MGSWLTRTRFFKSLTKWAFGICDANNTGSISEAELYAGVLLVHLTLAKHAGSAACYPPTRAKVKELFYAADQNHNGQIESDEFDYIMVILCSQIAGRIIMYYTFLILAVPYLASWSLQFLDFIGVDDTILGVDYLFDTYAPKFMVYIIDKIPDSVWENMPEQIVSLCLFFFVIPFALELLDRLSIWAANDTVGASPKEEETVEKKNK